MHLSLLRLLLHYFWPRNEMPKVLQKLYQKCDNSFSSDLGMDTNAKTQNIAFAVLWLAPLTKSAWHGLDLMRLWQAETSLTDKHTRHTLHFTLLFFSLLVVEIVKAPCLWDRRVKLLMLISLHTRRRLLSALHNTLQLCLYCLNPASDLTFKTVKKVRGDWEQQRGCHR